MRIAIGRSCAILAVLAIVGLFAWTPTSMIFAAQVHALDLNGARTTHEDLTSRAWTPIERFEYTLGVHSHAEYLAWMAQRFPDVLEDKLEAYIQEMSLSDLEPIQAAAWNTIRVGLKDASRTLEIQEKLKTKVDKNPFSSFVINSVISEGRLSRKFAPLSEAFQRLAVMHPNWHDAAAEAEVDAYLERLFDGGKPISCEEVIKHIHPKKPLLEVYYPGLRQSPKERKISRNHGLESLPVNGFAVIPASDWIDRRQMRRLLRRSKALEWFMRMTLRTSLYVDINPLWALPAPFLTRMPTHILSASFASLGPNMVVPWDWEIRRHRTNPGIWMMNFHLDGIPFRLLITLAGRATWYVDRGQIFEPNIGDALIIAGSMINSEYPEMFLNGQEYPPALHASPWIADKSRMLWLVKIQSLLK